MIVGGKCLVGGYFIDFDILSPITVLPVIDFYVCEIRVSTSDLGSSRTAEFDNCCGRCNCQGPT